MLFFGVGTLPVMLGLTSILQLFINKFRFSFRYVTTVTMIALGLLLIVRTTLVRHGHEGTHVPGEIVICK